MVHLDWKVVLSSQTAALDVASVNFIRHSCQGRYSHIEAIVYTVGLTGRTGGEVWSILALCSNASTETFRVPPQADQRL